MGNFIDKTFTVIADILLKVLPASKQEKQAFSYYRAGMAAQSQGKYAEALENYYEAKNLRLYIFFNLAISSISLEISVASRIKSALFISCSARAPVPAPTSNTKPLPPFKINSSATQKCNL